MALNSSIPAQHQTTRKKQCEIIRRILLVAVVMSQGGSPRSPVNGSRWQDSASAHQSCHPARAKGELIGIIRSTVVPSQLGMAITTPRTPPQGCLPYISYQSPRILLLKDSCFPYTASLLSAWSPFTIQSPASLLHLDVFTA
jgi:hypothetical protein